MTIEIVIQKTKEKDEFGYRVLLNNKHKSTKELIYENRADGDNESGYCLQEQSPRKSMKILGLYPKNFEFILDEPPSLTKWQDIGKEEIKNKKEANKILYNLAKNKVEKALQSLTPKLIDRRHKIKHKNLEEEIKWQNQE